MIMGIWQILLLWETRAFKALVLYARYWICRFAFEKKMDFKTKSWQELKALLNYQRKTGETSKLTPCEPKRLKMQPQGYEKTSGRNPTQAEGSQKRAQRVPKINQNASKDRCSEKLADKCEKTRPSHLSVGPFWDRFSIKNTSKNHCTNQCPK